MYKFKKFADPSVGSYQSDRKYKKPLITQICKKSLEYEGIERNPVIVVHGFLGSHLKNMNNGQTVWGSFQGVDLLKGFSDSELSELSLPMEHKMPLRELKDEVSPVGLLDTFDVNLFGVHFQKDAYNRMIKILENSGYVNREKPLPPGKKYHSLFTFFYDWRRDLAENAALLYDFVEAKREYLRERYLEVYGVKDYDVRFDILAHSMGGLVSRYFIRYGKTDLDDIGIDNTPNWSGSRFIDKLVLIGTPNAGYLDTCSELINGLQIAKHLPFYPPAVIGTFHSYYQMMPIESSRRVKFINGVEGDVNMFDFNNWIEMKWGLADPTQDKYLKILLPDMKSWTERRKVALDHLRKCLKRACRFTKAMSSNTLPPFHLTTLLFCGNAVETSHAAEVDAETGKFTITEYGSGDGKVLSTSARLDQREGASEWSLYAKSPIKWDTVVHLRAAHMGITDSFGFSHNLIYYLLGMPPKRLDSRNLPY